MENSPPLEKNVRQRETLLEKKLVKSKDKAGHKERRQQEEERAGEEHLHGGCS